ncbi:hypothetical protein [Pseudoxanthomonas mexicana]
MSTSPTSGYSLSIEPTRSPIAFETMSTASLAFSAQGPNAVPIASMWPSN